MRPLGYRPYPPLLPLGRIVAVLRNRKVTLDEVRRPVWAQHDVARTEVTEALIASGWRPAETVAFFSPSIRPGHDTRFGPDVDVKEVDPFRRTSLRATLGDMIERGGKR